MKERSKNQQFVINLTASLITFFVNLGIRFFLTPYIVRTLGAEAYGFIGLSTNILSYTGLITIALNSMAGRFITIAYTSGKIEEANKYFASVFYSNIVLAIVILVGAGACTIWLEYLIRIPQELVMDVKLLFSILAINTIIGLVTGLWGVATFIKNRLDLSNIRSIIGNIIQAATLVLCFSLLPPHIWYMGIAGMLLTLYVAITNRTFSQQLTPDLKVHRTFFDWGKIKELLLAGIWNLFSKLGEILGQGLDLLIANICIGTATMGYFALTKNVPFLILSLFQTISGVFAPIFTHQYAQNKIADLVSELNKSIRVLCCFTAIPLTFLYIFGDSFYHLWLPTEDASELQFLTILGTFALPFTLPLESLWNIFTITNKLKVSTLFTLANNLVVFLIVMTSMLIFESPDSRLLVLASTRSLCGILRGLFFLPMYGAHCLGLSIKTFYNPILKSVICLVACLAIAYPTRFIFIPATWWELGLAFFFVSCICIGISYLFVLSRSDREFIKNRITSTFKYAHQ